MDTVLLVDAPLWDHPERRILDDRLRIRGTGTAPVAGPPGHRALLRAAAGRVAWLVTGDPAWIPAAGTAGLQGVVLIGCPHPAESGSLVVAVAESLLDAPRVMVPPGGGCWHS